MTVEERVWNAVSKPRTSREVWQHINRRLDSRLAIPWERIEQALQYWLDTGLVRVTNKRFWRHPNTASMNIHKEVKHG